MHRSWKLPLALGGIGFLLMGCVQGYNAPAASRQAADTGAADAADAVAADYAAVTPDPVTTGEGLTDTMAGRKAADLTNDWSRLDQQVEGIYTRLAELKLSNQESSERYHSLVGLMTARLQRGTTPGNPVLLSQWSRAAAELSKFEGNTAEMLGLSAAATNASTLGQYLMNSVQAIYGLSGAVEDDHAVLRELEGQLYQTLARIDRLMGTLSEDISRQNAYVSNERQNLTTMSLAIENGELYGASLSSRSFIQMENAAREAAQAIVLEPGEEPLMVVRFDRPNVSYQQPMYDVISQAIVRKPSAVFVLEAVSPKNGNAAQIAMNSTSAKRRAQEVLRTLMDMGISGNRVQTIASLGDDVDVNEVRLYVR